MLIYYKAKYNTIPFMGFSFKVPSKECLYLYKENDSNLLRFEDGMILSMTDEYLNKYFTPKDLGIKH